MKGKKTFKEMCDELRAQPSPIQAFIADCAAAAGVNETTVRQWSFGTWKPNKQAMMLLAAHLGEEVETLFPPEP